MRAPGTAVIAEDDAEISDLIQMVLTQSGFSVVVAHDGFQAIAAVREHQPVLTTLDVNMPGIDGFAVARELRRFSETYLIMITALNEEVDIIRGFEAGADDYLVKPFRPRELRARADSMLRRMAARDVGSPAPTSPAPPAPEPESWAAAAARDLRGSLGQAVPPATPPAPAPPPAPAAVSTPAAPVARGPQPEETGDVLRFGDLSMDAVTGAAVLQGRALDLTRPEADILVALLRTGRRVRSKADLVLTIRGQDYVTSYFISEADKRAVEGHVAVLRRKLGDDGPTPRYLETVRGVGYRMAERD